MTNGVIVLKNRINHVDIFVTEIEFRCNPKPPNLSLQCFADIWLFVQGISCGQTETFLEYLSWFWLNIKFEVISELNQPDFW